MSISSPPPPPDPALIPWLTAPDWRTLLRLNADFISDLDATAPYPLPGGLRITEDLQPAALSLQSFGFLVRYACSEWESRPFYTGEPAPQGPWKRTQVRSWLHLVLPTEEGAVSQSSIEELLLCLLRDRENLEVVVLADWVEYPAAAAQVLPNHARKAEPVVGSSDPRARGLEMFHSSVNRDANTRRRAKITGKTTGRTMFADTKDRLKSGKWARFAELPYETVDDVLPGTKDTRALGMKIQAVREAKVLEIVVASKSFKTGEGDDMLDLPEYVTTLCHMAGMDPVFEDL